MVFLSSSIQEKKQEAIANVKEQLLIHKWIVVLTIKYKQQKTKQRNDNKNVNKINMNFLKAKFKSFSMNIHMVIIFMSPSSHL